jgi:SPP1 gp7 family putative phage head morphogenesis protein
MGIEATARVVTSARTFGRVERRRKVPRALYPMTVENEYGNRLAGIMRAIGARYAPLLERMPALLAGVNRVYEVRADAHESEAARQLLESAYAQAQVDLRAQGVDAIARLAGERTSQVQRRELAKQIKAGLGVDVAIDESRTRDILQYFATENATRIANVPEKMHLDVANLTMRALSKRMTPETYATELRKIVDGGETWARQIARDQIGTLNGQLTEVRQLELGITHYLWETRRDGRVRDTHVAREGQSYPWSRAPAGGHPGIDYGCRCTAKPDLSGVLAKVEERERARR